MPLIQFGSRLELHDGLEVIPQELAKVGEERPLPGYAKDFSRRRNVFPNHSAGGSFKFVYGVGQFTVRQPKRRLHVHLVVFDRSGVTPQ